MCRRTEVEVYCKARERRRGARRARTELSTPLALTRCSIFVRYAHIAWNSASRTSIMHASDDPADGAPDAYERRRQVARLRTLAARLDHQAALIRNGGFNPAAEAQAGRLADDAYAVRWALRRVGPAR